MDGFHGFDHASAQTSMQAFDNGQMVPTGADSAYGVKFYMGKVPNFDGTDYQEVPHLRLTLAGDNNRVYDQPVIMESTPARLSDPERFPREWAAFQRGEAVGNLGTLLVDWDRLEPGDVRRFEMQGVKTVEQLAAIGDHQLPQLGAGARVLRDAARAHVAGMGRADPEKAAMAEQIRTLTDLVMGLGTPAAPQPDPEKEMLNEQVGKLSGIVEGLLGMLTPEQRAALGTGGSQEPAEESRAPRRQRANA